jgi:hypothetical protein
MALNKSSLSLQPWPAADDDKIKFSEFDRAVETVVRYGASVMARYERPHRPHGLRQSLSRPHRF